MESILTSIKKLLGITEDDVTFDTDIIIHINTTLMILSQAGVGPTEGFTISDKNPVWNDFIGDEVKVDAVKTYVYLKVKGYFDPHTNSYLSDASERQAQEILWRSILRIEGEVD